MQFRKTDSGVSSLHRFDVVVAIFLYFCNAVAVFAFSQIEASTMKSHLRGLEIFPLLLFWSSFVEASFGLVDFFDEGGGDVGIGGIDGGVGGVGENDFGSFVGHQRVVDMVRNNDQVFDSDNVGLFAGDDAKNCSRVTNHKTDADAEDDADGRILSRQKRNFGGREPIDYVKAINATFLVAGWVTQGCEAFNDIQFHLLGYTVLGEMVDNLLSSMATLNQATS